MKVTSARLAAVTLAHLVGLIGWSQPSQAYLLAALPEGGEPTMDFLKKGDVTAARGLCLDQLKNDPNDILSRAGVKTLGARREEIEALAKGIQKIEDLGGGDFSPVHGAVMQFFDRPGSNSGFPFGRFNGTTVEIHRAGTQSDTNLAHLMHEISHYIGSKENLYARYKSAVPSCQFTKYTRYVNKNQAPRNEEFGEVFSAFVTHPELLLRSSPNCRAAYKFFSTSVFKKGQELARCNSGQNMMASRSQPNEILAQISPTIENPAPAPENSQSGTGIRIAH